MADSLRTARAAAGLELRVLLRAPVLLVFVALEAVTFVVLVSLFGLTGSRAPTAVVNEDGGPLAASFAAYLGAAHHSFALRPMTASQAAAQLRDGRLVAAITIPRGFSEEVASGRTVVLPVDVDNVDVDLTDDIQRAVPSAVAAFGRAHGFPGIRVAAAERDLIGHDTGYIPYLVVSALALDALVVAGALGALAVTREDERGTITQWRLAPTSYSWLLAGKLLVAATVSTAAVAVASAIVLAAYGISPTNVLGLLSALLLCVVIFTCVGACAGAVVRRSLPVAAVLFGLALPLYLDSGALEPERFDGPRIWALAHASPVYFAVGVLERAAHGLRVTPESTGWDVVVLCAWAGVSLAVASTLLGRRLATR
ncbi:MAG TPA: ABC transporter permease [Acidimicrobiales bacterium]|nr:ABC transporter permease [Acidimicrobiales bacterium]